MATVLTLMQGLTAASAYAVTIMSSRSLGTEGRGVLVLLLQLTYFLSVFVVLGIERPFMASVRMPFSNAFRTFVGMLRPGLLLSWALLVAAATVALCGYPYMGVLGAVMAAYTLMNGVGKGVRVASVSSGEPAMLVWFTLGTQGGMLVLGFVLMTLEVDDPAVWYSAYALTGLTSVFILIASRRRSDAMKLGAKQRTLIRSQGLKLLPASIGNTAMVRSDRLILPVLAGLAELGAYSAVSTVMEMASWPIAQWVDASLGKWKRSGETQRKGDLMRISAKAVAVSAVFALSVGVVAYCSIIWLLPAEFAASIPLILPLGVSSIIYALGRVQQGALVVMNRGGVVSIIEIAGMAASILGYVALIPIFGAMGAAFGAIVGYGVSVIAGAIALYGRGSIGSWTSNV